jgi:Anti-repressor SinI
VVTFYTDISSVFFITNPFYILNRTSHNAHLSKHINKNTKQMEVFVNIRIDQAFKNIDIEWLNLILQAKEQGISLKEIRIFLNKQVSELIE